MISGVSESNSTSKITLKKILKHSFHEFLDVEETWQGPCFLDFWTRKKSSGDKSWAVPYSSRYVDSISDMDSGLAVDLLVSYLV